MLADYSEEDKILIKKECSGNFSLEVANTVFGLSIPHNPSGFFNSAKDLAISEGLKFLCEQHTAVEINSAIKKFHSRVDVELALKEQPICSQYVEQVGKDINALSKDIERVPYMVGAKAHGMAIVLQQHPGISTGVIFLGRIQPAMATGDPKVGHFLGTLHPPFRMTWRQVKTHHCQSLP